MRVSTANTYDASIEQLQRRQQQLQEGQLQLTSMKRVNRASDDPTAAARAERALALETRSEASQRAVDASRNAMTLGESALGDAIRKKYPTPGSSSTCQNEEREKSSR